MNLESDHRFHEMIDALPAAVLMTDAVGRLTHFNAAAVRFSGQLDLGTNPWFSGLKLLRPDGTFLPFDQSPMAIALQENRPVLGEPMIAERPDGTLRWFEPYSVPMRTDNGTMIGGINLLFDITDRKNAEVKLSQLASIVDSSDDAIASKTLDGVIASWNRAAERMFGYSTDEVIGKHISLIIPPERLGEEQEVLARLRRGEKIDHFVTERQAKDGHRLTISLTVSPIRNGDGEIVGASKVARDITEQMKAHEIVQQRTAQFETLLNRAPIGVFVVDAKLRIDQVNPIARTAFGGIPDLVGRDIDDVMQILWPKEFAAEIVGIIRSSLESGEVHALPERNEYRRDRGVAEVYEWQFNRIPMANDEQGVVCYFRDISSQVHVREALRDADRRKDEFLATLAHELRNPLAPIRNSLHILRLADSDSTAAANVREMIERQLNHMVRLVDDLMEVSRITRGRIELRKERIDIAAVVRSAVESSKPLIDAARHRLTISLPQEPLMLEADPVRLAQVVTNLLNNSAKYSEPEGQIWIAVRSNGEHAFLSVRDSGFGIPAEMLPKVFDIFAQVDRQTTRAQGGLGIGLTLVRSLIEMHEGRVEARSAGLGKGSEFLIQLPLAGSRGMSDNPIQQIPQQGSMNAHRILVVDDNRDAADSLGMLLGMLGADVRAVHDGPAALGALNTYRPSIVLLDIGMPEMDGYEVARRARQQPSGRDVKLIALTGWGQEQDRFKSKEAGFDHHLVKPVAIGELQSILADMSYSGSSNSPAGGSNL